MVVTLKVDLEKVAGQGWVAHRPGARTTAHGDTREEALTNLREGLDRYPEVLDEIWVKTCDHGRTVTTLLSRGG